MLAKQHRKIKIISILFYNYLFSDSLNPLNNIKVTCMFVIATPYLHCILKRKSKDKNDRSVTGGNESKVKKIGIKMESYISVNPVLNLISRVLGLFFFMHEKLLFANIFPA